MEFCRFFLNRNLASSVYWKFESAEQGRHTNKDRPTISLASSRVFGSNVIGA